MTIAVASGKVATGKTTEAANLVLSLPHAPARVTKQDLSPYPSLAFMNRTGAG
jgi:MinD-like ATPase involved in chromosome partitioning or flagellar assembly